MDDKKSIDEVNEVLGKTSRFTINSKEEFNKCVDHVVQLIFDASILYKAKSFSTSAFLSIAILEEVGKIHMGLYIKGDANTKLGKDPLRKHTSKQIIGTNYTITIGKRLQEAIGEKVVNEMFQLVYSGGVKDLREKALYCDRENDNFTIPSEIISEGFARNILLLAIESFDDNLVGYSDHSIEKSKETDGIFEDISQY